MSRDEMIARYRALTAKKAAHGLTSAEAYEMQGLAEALDHMDELAVMRRPQKTPEDDMTYEIARHDENGYTFWTVSFFDRDGRLADRQTAATKEGASLIVRRMCG